MSDPTTTTPVQVPLAVVLTCCTCDQSYGPPLRLSLPAASAPGPRLRRVDLLVRADRAGRWRCSMNGPEHYREAERLRARADELHTADAALALAAAQVHATFVYNIIASVLRRKFVGSIG